MWERASSFRGCLFARLWLRLLKVLAEAFTSAVGHCNAAHTSVLHARRFRLGTKRQTETSQKRHSCSVDVQPALSTLWTITYLRFVSYDMGANSRARWLMNYSSGKGKKMKSFERGFFFFPRLAGKDDAQMDIMDRGRWIMGFKSYTASS